MAIVFFDNLIIMCIDIIIFKTTVVIITIPAAKKTQPNNTTGQIT